MHGQRNLQRNKVQQTKFKYGVNGDSSQYYAMLFFNADFKHLGVSYHANCSIYIISMASINLMM